MKLTRYILGSRKGKEAHCVERDAMTDPFLADALEGYDSVEGNHAERLERMREQIARRTERKRARPLVWALAAVLLVLLSTGGYLLLRTDTNQQQYATVTKEDTTRKRTETEGKGTTKTEDIELNTSGDSEQQVRQQTELSTSSASVAEAPIVNDGVQQAQAAPPAPVQLQAVGDMGIADSRLNDGMDKSRFADGSTDFSRFNISSTEKREIGDMGVTDFRLTNGLDKSKLADGSTDFLKLKVPSTEKPEAVGVATKDLFASYSIASDEKAKATTSDQYYIASDRRAVAEEVATTGYAAKRMNMGASVSPAPRLQTSIRGKVVDEHGEPLPFVTIMAKGSTATGTVSDEYGNFTLTDPYAKTIVASFIGFDTKELAVDTTKPMLIAMREESRQLDEVVITAYGRQSSEEREVHVEPTPEPEIGYSAYRQYLKEKLVRPTGACANAEGKVVVTFYVSGGRPYNLRIKKSLCEAADQEAMRLIEQGCDWTSGSKEVSVTVKF